MLSFMIPLRGYPGQLDRHVMEWREMVSFVLLLRVKYPVLLVCFFEVAKWREVIMMNGRGFLCVYAVSGSL